MKEWTEEEIQFLREYLTDYPIKEIANEIGRSVKSVNEKAKELGIVKDIPQGFKKCIDCNKVKPLENFYVKKASKDGRNCYCMECDKVRRRNFTILQKTKADMDLLLEKERLAEILKRSTDNVYFECVNCGHKKVGQEFYFDSKKLKRFNLCIVCYLNRQKENEVKKIIERGY